MTPRERDLSRAEKARKIFELIKTNRTDVNEQVMKAFEENPSILEECDESGMTALDQACFKGNEELLDFLLKMGASADNRRHHQGYTCLMFAAMSGKPDMCRKVLNAGARPHATNNIHKTASEIAAFIGNHEVVSVIANHVDISEIEKFVHPKGKDSEEQFPAEFVNFIHQLVSTHHIHPVRMTFELCRAKFMMDYRKKFEYIIDRMFEKQLRSKEANEVMSLKLWLILYIIRDTFKFVDDKLAEKPELTVEKAFFAYARNLLRMKPTDAVRPLEEGLLRGAIAAFPYKHSLLHKTLAKTLFNTPFGRPPPTYIFINQALFGQRLVATTAFCACCGISAAKLRCSRCKFPYCTVRCQEFDWPVHKSCCQLIAEKEQEQAREENPPPTGEFQELQIAGIPEECAVSVAGDDETTTTTETETETAAN